MARHGDARDHAESSPSHMRLPACRALLPKIDINDLRCRLGSSPWEAAGLGESWLREAAFAFGVKDSSTMHRCFQKARMMPVFLKFEIGARRLFPVSIVVALQIY